MSVYREHPLLPNESVLAPEDLPVAACDVDDVMWPLWPEVARRVGVPVEANTEFDTSQNDRLTADQKAAVLAAYCDASVFEALEFFDGVEDLLRLERAGARLEIHSRCRTPAIREVKRRRLLAKIKGLRPEHLFLTVVDEAPTQGKCLPPGTLVALEDSPYNIAVSPAKLNIIPAAGWNTSEKAHMLMRGHATTYVPYGDFETMLKVAEHLVYTEVTRRFHRMR